MIKIKNTLIIDTSNNQKVIVGLRIVGEEFIKEQEIDQHRAQVVLPMIDMILTEHSLQLKDINAIQVNTGPGSFTGIRVGVTIANTIAYALKIPVNNKKIGELAVPSYT